MASRAQGSFSLISQGDCPALLSLHICLSFSPRQFPSPLPPVHQKILPDLLSLIFSPSTNISYSVALSLSIYQKKNFLLCYPSLSVKKNFLLCCPSLFRHHRLPFYMGLVITKMELHMNLRTLISYILHRVYNKVATYITFRP